MKDVLCYSVDAESPAGVPLARRYGVTGFPTLLFLEPDGEVRDLIYGFLPATPFQTEVARIKRDEETLGHWKRILKATPEDLEARWRYALKLKDIQDQKGYEEQVRWIKQKDPQGKSIGARTLRFEKLKEVSLETMDFQPVYNFLDAETDEGLLVDGWFFLFRVESYLADEGDDQSQHRKLQVSAARAMWSHTKSDLQLRVAGEIAAIFLNNSEGMSDEHKALLNEVTSAVSKNFPEDALAQALYGDCLYALGKREKAITQLKRALELDPKNAGLRERLSRYERP